MILLSDIHIGLNKANPIFYKTVIHLFEEIVDEATKRDLKTIIVLGDLFENRRIISQKSMKVMQKVIETCTGMDLILLRGNHDSYYADAAFPNWLTGLKEYQNVTTVEDEPLFIEDLCLVPWGYPIEKLKWDKTLLGHFEINSFKMNDSFVCQGAKLSPKDFVGFKSVYSGHFHFPATISNITYLGSPFQQNFSDIGSQRGFYILQDDSLEFIEFTSAPKFHKIYTEAFNEDKSLIKGNFISLVFEKDYGLKINTEIVEEAERLSPAALSVDTLRFSADFSAVEDYLGSPIEDNLELFIDYLKKQAVPEHLNVNLLIKVAEKIWKENLEEDKGESG